MGDTHHDPSDHSRTHLAHSGITMKDNFYWPGLFLLALGVLGIIGTVAAAAYRHHEFIAATGLVAALAMLAGAVWLIVERRRVTRLEERWVAEHPEPMPRSTAA
jgi:uncharacterized membrane protein YcjF (UPF0283 family)